MLFVFKDTWAALFPTVLADFVHEHWVATPIARPGALQVAAVHPLALHAIAASRRPPHGDREPTKI